jgi:hypothetical protein
MVGTGSTAEIENIKKVFREEKIILTEGGGWAKASGVFVFTDEDAAPGAPVVRAAVRDLVLWRKLDVAERPTAELTIQWLKDLPSNQALSQLDARRFRALLPRYAARIWKECEHWVNLAGEWVPTATLDYALTMQSLVSWNHLHGWVKQKTADLLRLPGDMSEVPPFSHLPHLASRIEERFCRDPLLPSPPERKVWLSHLGSELRRIELEDAGNTVHIQGLAAALADTTWQTTPGLETIPYLDGTPAGVPRQAEVLWLNKVLYVEDRPLARVARSVSQELGRAFRSQDIADAIKLCFDRSPEFITDYLEENFKLVPRDPVEPVAGVSTDDPPVVSGDLQILDSNDGGRLVDEERVVSDGSNGSTPEAGISSQAEVDGDREDDLGDADGLASGRFNRRRRRAIPTGSSIMELYVRNQGFQKDGEGRFVHADGSWIGKSYENRFPWERRSASGAIIRCYWPKDHCLEQEPLQLDADVWGLLDKFPDTYALVLSDPEGNVVELVGQRLRSMCHGGEVTLYPASYRLVYDHSRQQ